MLEVNWHPIEHGVYAAIYSTLHDQLSVFGTHTCMGGCEWHVGQYVLTEWGFNGADAPLIRSIRKRPPGDEMTRHDDEWSYWIAEVKKEDDDE